VTVVEHVATIPQIRSFDEAKAREFYCGFLGFHVDFEHRFEPDSPLFMGLSLNGMRLYVSEHFGDAAPGAHIVFKVRHLRDYHAGLIAKDYRHARPGIEPYIGGGQSVSISDPFGNLIQFVEDSSS
jgi:catechol 2,3-dioxygenase-like lactoylglutathione lyase family enzyme